MHKGLRVAAALSPCKCFLGVRVLQQVGADLVGLALGVDGHSEHAVHFNHDFKVVSWLFLG